MTLLPVTPKPKAKIDISALFGGGDPKKEAPVIDSKKIEIPKAAVAAPKNGGGIDMSAIMGKINFSA